MTRQQSLAFFAALNYPPTPAELDLSSATGPLEAPMKLVRGRLVLEGMESLVDEHEKRRLFLPRKLRVARKAARLLARLSGVRFVALCNTTALGHARDEGDLDFFVVTRTGVVTQTRGWATLWFKLFGKRPGSGSSDRDAVCLSYFVDDSALDLSSHMLPDGDPYFSHWFISMLPLYDDGVSAELWKTNEKIRALHPNAIQWIMSPDLRVQQPGLRLPAIPGFESAARSLHEAMISPKLKAMRNQDTRVIVNEHVLKFHADDGRIKFRERYQDICRQYGIAP